MQPLTYGGAIDDEDLINTVMVRNSFTLSDALPDQYGLAVYNDNKVYNRIAWLSSGSNSNHALLGAGYAAIAVCVLR